MFYCSRTQNGLLHLCIVMQGFLCGFQKQCLLQAPELAREIFEAHRSISGWLKKHDVLDILTGACFYEDETSFYLHPKSKKQLTKTGSRKVYDVNQAPGKQNVTVIFAFGAAGCWISGRLRNSTKRKRLDGCELFSFVHPEHLASFPSITECCVPCYFFVDAHATHKLLEVADLCLSLGIVLISPYPNATCRRRSVQTAEGRMEMRIRTVAFRPSCRYPNICTLR